MAQLLVVEDDAAIRGALIRALTERGHAVTSQPSAMAALQHVLDSPPDLILLDLGLPDLGGYDALRMMRAITSVPVVVVTARDDEAEIIRVLDAGADDYVVKPFGAGQLDARIRAVLRRAAGAGPGTASPLKVGGLRLDPDAHEATLDGAPLDLSPREFDLLHYLARPPARWSPGGSCSPTSGSCRTAARTRRSTCTCRGCAASSARPRSTPATCTRCAGSGSSSARP